ncbi:N-acetylmuramoyl-L-alanine amidase [Shimia ponticola]|uniref:N-acetylmuramoyl-L-alanine amidase n=1 Tax=Shimia ponticola TaxID=2582893 RepID=UPI003D2B64E3
MKTSAAALERLCDPAHEVSAHYLISRQGQVWQMVEEADRAWHAGAGNWAGMDDINSRSIGIELTNTGVEPFPEPQMQALTALVAGIQKRWSITPHNVIGHQDMAPTRKADPGRRFDWARLARLGLASAAASQGPDAPLSDSLDQIGYPKDVSLEARLEAFRARFRPGAEGPETESDRRAASAVAQRITIDRQKAQA